MSPLHFFFLQSENTLYHLRNCQSEKWYDIHDLASVANNHMKVKTENTAEKLYSIQLHSFDITLSLKESQGHWKWYKEVKLSKKLNSGFNHPASLTFISLIVFKETAMLICFPC